MHTWLSSLFSFCFLTVFSACQGSGQRIRPPLGVLKKQESEKIWANTKLLLAWAVFSWGSPAAGATEEAWGVNEKRPRCKWFLPGGPCLSGDRAVASSWVSRYHSRHVRIALTKDPLPHLGMGSPNPLASIAIALYIYPREGIGYTLYPIGSYL